MLELFFQTQEFSATFQYDVSTTRIALSLTFSWGILGKISHLNMLENIRQNVDIKKCTWGAGKKKEKKKKCTWISLE